MPSERRVTRNNSMAPYYVTMRDAERQMLRDAITFCNGNQAEAARMLGVSLGVIINRAKLLGGVYEDDPKNEPPK